MPQPSASSASLYARRPTQTISLSKVSVLVSPLTSVVTTTSPFTTSALVTLVSTRMSKPCFLSSLAASFEMSLSATARNSGMASYTTTSEPRRRHTEPSSRPMTPAPITPRRFGASLNSSAPVESTMCSPSVLATGISIGTEPAARITYLAVMVVSVPS